MNNTINLDEFKFDLSQVELLRTECRHVYGGIEEVEVYKCTCKVVFMFSHLDRNHRPDMGFGSCKVASCNGYQAHMSGSSYVFPCEDHTFNRR